MRSKELNLSQYDSDKIASRYLEQYDLILSPWINNKVVLLELGVHKGGSLQLWRDYFTLGTIVGIDIKIPKEFTDTERIQTFQGSQSDTQFLSRVANEVAPNGFDVIIDDASHVGQLTKTAFWHLFDNHLKSGGLYVIEDWGTGYWDDWSDGKSLNIDLSQYQSWWSPFKLFLLKLGSKLNIKSPMQCHSYGMVGFIKQLLDEQAASDVTRGSWKGVPKRKSRFEKIIVTPSIVFVKKAND